MKAFQYSMMAVSLLATGLPVVHAQEGPKQEGWEYSLSIGSVTAPSYLGADTQQLSAIPGLDISYKDLFFAGTRGIGFNLVNSNGWRIGPIAKYGFGRKENGDNPLLIGGDETDELLGLGDIDGALEAGGFVEYTYQRIQGKVEVRQASGGHDGLVGEVELRFNGSVQLFGKQAFYGIGPEFAFGDDSYNSAYFGVTPTQSAASGLAEYEATSGVVSYGVGASVFVPVDQHFSLIGFAEFSQLTGDAKESSLVTERGSPNQALGGLMLNYSF